MKPLLIALLVGGWFGSAMASTTKSFVPVQGERLSELLSREGLLPSVSNQYLQGMLLNRQAYVQGQSLQKTQLLTALQTSKAKVPSYLVSFVQGLPVTGRQLLPSQDGHELAAKNTLNPVLQAGDRLLVPARPVAVLVLSDRGQCAVAYSPEVSVHSYLDTCFPKSSVFALQQGFDQASLVQPTGQLQKVDVGLWNFNQAVLPQPGAWIWAPSRGSAWPQPLSAALVDFLQTQGPFLGAATLNNLPPKDTKAYSAVPEMYTVRPTRGDWGGVGLLQMPSARMADAGTISITASRVEPYSRYSFIYQPFDWLEAGFRYSIVTNRLFGAREFSGDRKYQDKSVDAKLRLFKESAYLPEISMGLRDIGGTGFFSSEYFVANKRAGVFDFTLGLGFGNMASAGGVNNPFGFVAEEFKQRPQVNFGVGGEANSETYFRGPAALFAGVQWQTPLRDLVFKLELDGNNYQNEPLSNPQEQSSRINYGVVYRINDSIDFSASVQRGNTLGFALSFSENVSKYSVPKLSDPKPIEPTLGPRPASAEWPQTIKLVEQQTTWNVSQVEQRGSEVKLTVKNSDLTYHSVAVNKAAAALHENLPDDINWFTFEYQNRGANVAQHVVNRDQWALEKTELPAQAVINEPVVAVQPNTYAYSPVYLNPKPWYKPDVGLGYEQTFGGANGYLFQFTAYAGGELNFTNSTWLAGRLDHVLGGTFDKFTQGASSALPQVRTNFREYATASDTKLSNLQVNHTGQLGQNHFYSAYGGYLEAMFGGVGAEYLYRPMNSSLAIGVDVNHVKQRAFEQDFDFRDYSVNTGHLTAYWDTGFEDILATVSVGQYLAGDKGVTVDLARVFDNGVRIGAYASKTNVSAEEFGEGSFDKGIYLKVPFDALFTSTIPGDASFRWVQVTRDGGAKLRRKLELFEETSLRSGRALDFKPVQ